MRSFHRTMTSAGVFVLCLSVPAQLPIAASTGTPQTPANQIGTQAVDVIPLRSYMGGTPLQHGSLIPGSEKVTLNGAALHSGQDYAMDYSVGVVYLKITQKLGDSLMVAYEYDPKGSTSGASNAFGGFQLNLLPGSSVIMGLGLADRESSGNVVSSNVFGYKNSLNFGNSGSVSGLMLLANQQATYSASAYQSGASGPASTSQTAQNSTRFILENYKSKVAGGSVSFDVQDISKDFANFSAVQSAGYSASDVSKLKAEKGFDRLGFNAAGLKFGGLSLDDSYKSVKDQSGGITWQNYGIADKGFSFKFNSQKVEENFGRFNDLAEADKAQLAKEKGMSRQGFAGAFQQKVGTFSFTDLSIQDDLMKKGIRKTDFAFDSARYKADYGDEKVDSAFLRASSLTAAETAQYAREVGMSRRWLTFSATPDAKSKPFTFGQLELTSPTGKFTEQDAAYSGKHWSLSHINIGGSSSFASMSALQDDFVTADLAKIANTFGNSKAPTPADKAAFLGDPTLRRNYTSLAGDFAKRWSLTVDSLGLAGAKDNGTASDVSLTNGSLVASLHRQDFGKNLTEVSGLMPFELQKLGQTPGLKREDFNFSDQLNKSSKLAVTNLNADMTTGSVDRTTIDYATKGFSLDASQRRVDSGFMVAGQLVDPEAAILASLAGYRQRDMKMSWNSLKTVSLTGEAQDQWNQATNEYKSLSTFKFNFNPDKSTQIDLVDNRSDDHIKANELLQTEMRQFSFAKDFGKYGKFAFLDEMDLDNGASSTLPSSHKDYLSYETKLAAGTSFKTEQTVTTFADGTNQSISAETLSQQVTKRIGVSLTEAQVSGDAKLNNPGKTDYGVWYDLGGGVRISYGYAHQYNDGTGTVNNSLTVGANKTAPAANQMSTLTPGVLGPVSFAGGFSNTSYLNAPGTANHNQGFNNVNLTTVKPLTLGPLRNIKFNLGMDSASDYATWAKNNQSGGFSGTLGSNDFSYNYKGQLATKGVEGIDRAFSLQTSKSAKALLVASINYKLRTLPGNVDYVIRDYNITARPMRNIDITDQLQTNPEAANSAVFLGSTPQASRSDKWAINYHQGADTTLGATYQELINTSSNLRATTGGITLKLFQKSGSPVSLFYGQEDSIGGTTLPHRLTSRYSVEFDQHPGPTQTFSMFLGNVSYDYNTPAQLNRENWTARLNYQLRF